MHGTQFVAIVWRVNYEGFRLTVLTFRCWPSSSYFKQFVHENLKIFKRPMPFKSPFIRNRKVLSDIVVDFHPNVSEPNSTINADQSTGKSNQNVGFDKYKTYNPTVFYFYTVHGLNERQIKFGQINISWTSHNKNESTTPLEMLTKIWKFVLRIANS